MSTLEVLVPGVQSLIQDMGRPGLTSMGVPPGGAADCISHRIANYIVGNPKDSPTIEMAMIGVTLRCLHPATMCLAGAAAEQAAITDASGRSRPFAPLLPVRVEAGQMVRVGNLTRGLRAYLAIRGGISVPHVLSSASTLLGAGLGGFDGRALRAGDRLSIADGAGTPAEVSARVSSWLETTLRPPRLRVVAGCDHALFAPDAAGSLIADACVVLPRTNRVGIGLERREHHALNLGGHGQGRMKSAGLAYGAIEIPDGGQPIILGPDHPTTGGYPVIACVIAADLPAVGQLAPGDTVRFELVTLEAARAAYQAQARWLDQELS